MNGPLWIEVRDRFGPVLHPKGLEKLLMRLRGYRLEIGLDEANRLLELSMALPEPIENLGYFCLNG